MRLKDKVAIITGAGSGFGRGSAELFAQEGAKVACVDINEAAAQMTADGINKSGGKAIAIKCDISKSKEVQEMVEKTVAEFGKLDVLFNNAGIPHMGMVVNVTEEEWDRVHAINLKGQWLCAKYAIPHLIKTKGAMIHTSSLAGVRGRAGCACYGAMKAGLMMMSQIMAIELAPHKVRSNCVCPVVGATPMGEELLKMASAMYGLSTGPDWDASGAAKMAEATIPLNTMTEPKDVAYAALYLASDESRLVTGTYILVDGGSRAS